MKIVKTLYCSPRSLDIVDGFIVCSTNSFAKGWKSLHRVGRWPTVGGKEKSQKVKVVEGGWARSPVQSLNMQRLDRDGWRKYSKKHKSKYFFFLNWWTLNSWTLNFMHICLIACYTGIVLGVIFGVNISPRTDPWQLSQFCFWTIFLGQHL